MDIYPWFNSKDMGAHLREVGHTLNAAEMAYIINQNDTATLEQKLDAWHEIVETEPDCELRKDNTNTGYWPSTHEFLGRLVELQRKKLELFNEPGGCLFCPRNIRRPGNVNDGKSTSWIGPDLVAFSSVEKCIDYLKREYGKEEAENTFHKGTCDRFYIGKLRADRPHGPEALENGLILNEDFEIRSVDASGLSNEERGIDYLVTSWFLALPCPFRSGDIVVDATDPAAVPFVFDRLKFWDSKDLASHGADLHKWSAEQLDAHIAKKNASGSWDWSDMAPLGYELAIDLQNPIHDHGCIYYDDFFGARYNYLNLERYDGPLKGEHLLLGIVSEHMKGKLDVEEFLNFSQLISLDVHADALRRDFDLDYDWLTYHLYGGELDSDVQAF